MTRSQNFPCLYCWTAYLVFSFQDVSHAKVVKIDSHCEDCLAIARGGCHGCHIHQLGNLHCLVLQNYLSRIFLCLRIGHVHSHVYLSCLVSSYILQSHFWYQYHLIHSYRWEAQRVSVLWYLGKVLLVLDCKLSQGWIEEVLVAVAVVDDFVRECVDAWLESWSDTWDVNCVSLI